MLALTIRLVASLAVVVGLMLLLARFAGRRMRGTRGSAVQVLHRQPLSRGSGVAVVTIGTRVLVLGTTEQQVSLLTELDPDEMLDDEQLAALEQLDAQLDVQLDAPLDAPPAAATDSRTEAQADTTFDTVLAGIAVPTGDDAGRPTGAVQPAAQPAVQPAVQPTALLPDDWRETYAAQRRAFEIAAGIAPAGAAAPTPRTLADFDGFDVGADLIDLTEDGTDVVPTPAPAPTAPAPAVVPAAPAPAPATTADAPAPATPVVAPLRAPGSSRRASRPVAHGSALSGSILAPDTWRQAIAAVTGRAS